MSKSSRKNRPDSKRRLILALITATFFLLCHGVLGASHALGHTGVPMDGAKSHQMTMEEQGGSHTASHDTKGVASTHGGDMSLVYAAVMAASAFGAWLFASLLGVKSPLRVLPPARHYIPALPRFVVPCRGPTPIRLQVFRL